MNYFKGQTKRPNKTQNDHGITLVALIITIIILIILAVVTINALTHDGLADLAIKSTQDYQKAQSDEMNMLNEIDSMVKETLKNIEDGTVKPKPEEPTPAPPDFSDTIELVNNNIGASTDYQTPSDRTFSTAIDGVEYSGYSSGNTFNSNDIAFIWKIWNIDDENIYLISDKATAKQLTLSNYTGYNNGVTLLDNLCDTLYADTTTYSGMESRSLKLSDITNTRVLKDLTSNNTKNTNTAYLSTPYPYTFAYPRVWYDLERLDSSMEARETKYSYNNDPNGYTYLASNSTSPTPTQSGTNLKPYSTYWYNASMGQSSFKPIGSDSGATLYTLIMGTGLGSTNSYWLSSRCVGLYSSDVCNFGLQIVNSSGVDSYTLSRYYSGSLSSNSPSYAVRPLVQIPLSSCVITQNEDGTFHITPRG